MTASFKILARIASAAARWPRPAVWAVSLGALAAIVGMDMVTGINVSLLLPYVVLVSFVAWCLGEGPGLVIAVLIVAASMLLRDYQLMHDWPRHVDSAELWNGIGRLLTVGFIVVMVNGLRTAMDQERWQASVDHLTGVLNKRAFERLMTERVKAAQRLGATIILAYLDLDGFKDVNDRFGHSAGDKVLVSFAQAAERRIRAGDLFARIGGDEFVALLVVPGTESADSVAQLLHERLSDVLAATGFDVTCSMGALIAGAASLETGDNYLELADKLMYEVKRSGKNALRIGRMDPLATTLRSAFQPVETTEFDALLKAIDAPHLVRKQVA